MTRRSLRFQSYLCGQAKLAAPDLVNVIRERRYPALMRVAALRWLIHWSPIEVTQGRCYLQRRRLVRQHYGV